MKKKWTWSQMLLAAAAVALFISGSTLVAAKPGGGGGKPPKDDPPPPPEPVELPDVRYEIQLIPLPANADGTGSPSVNGFNNLGQVVGKYSSTDGQRMFIYDPLRDDVQAIDMNALVTDGLPTGWRLRSGLDINDWMVVVGNMEEISTGERRPVAIDLATTEPVVDLLPDVGVDSHGIQINENGDILGITGVVGGWETWIFTPDLSGNPELNDNPRLYGDPSLRPLRGGTPLNMSGKSFDPLLLSGPAPLFKMNNPVDNSPAQIAGEDADGNVFRFTLGDPEPEGFPELDVFGGLAALNDSGTFCGLSRGPKIKGRRKIDAFRFNQSLELLPLPTGSWDGVSGMNSSEDVLTFSYVYRNDWKWVKIDDLVAGEVDDMQAWSDGGPFPRHINDRGGDGPSDAGQITGSLNDGRIFVLTPFDPTPEPAP